MIEFDDWLGGVLEEDTEKPHDDECNYPHEKCKCTERRKLSFHDR